jgi:HEAT repeat protein
MSHGFDPIDRTSPPQSGEAKGVEALPPVEAPSAGFFLQLFLIPLIIVSIVVVVWLLFSWLAHMGGSPEDLVKGLKRGDDASWQKASALAERLRDPQQEHLKYDHQLAATLAAELESQVEAGRSDPNQVKLRVFICRALGEFRVDDGLDALLVAAQHEKNASDVDVRRTAIEAMAVLAINLPDRRLGEDDEVMRVLAEITTERRRADDTDDRRDELRSAAVFTLGVIGGDRALDRLVRVLDEDPYANARYNAATGLARHGDVRAIPGLVNMLDPYNDEIAASEELESGRAWKVGLVHANGIRAARQLAQRNQTDDLREVIVALETLVDADVPGAIRIQAEEALIELRQRAAAMRN